MLVFLFPKLGLTHGEEKTLPIPGGDSVAHQHNKKVVQNLPFLAVSGINSGATSETVGLTTPPTLYHQFSSQFIQDILQVAQSILTLQGQTDSLRHWYAKPNRD